MQHVWEFLAIGKAVEGKEPIRLNHNFVTESGRRSKATKQMFETIEKIYGLKEDAFENFYVRIKR